MPAIFASSDDEFSDYIYLLSTNVDALFTATNVNAANHLTRISPLIERISAKTQNALEPQQVNDMNALIREAFTAPNLREYNFYYVDKKPEFAFRIVAKLNRQIKEPMQKKIELFSTISISSLVKHYCKN